MALTVRFSTGYSVTYNGAHFCRYTTHGKELYESSKMGQWLATVPHDAIVETIAPCTTQMRGTTLDEAANLILNNPRGVSDYKIAELKRALADFSLRSLEWK